MYVTAATGRQPNFGKQINNNNNNKYSVPCVVIVLPVAGSAGSVTSNGKWFFFCKTPGPALGSAQANIL